MTTLEFCRNADEAETPTFLKVLKAIPQANLDYRPEPKSRTAAEIAWVLAQEEGALLALLRERNGPVEGRTPSGRQGDRHRLRAQRHGRQREARRAGRSRLAEEGANT